ncbi:MAG: hypothetical protein DRJ63_05835 [Thermoprotei archaeon]|nr:MAG: hypothetical protein DRJ63_05835 [Thermoprotei archaeon]
MKVVVLDTSALIHGAALLLRNTRAVTSPEVLRELKSSLSRYVLSALKERGFIEIKQPKSEYVRRARKIATKMGYHRDLSEADISVIALALEYSASGVEVSVFTDDYKIQSILKSVKVDFKPVVHPPIGQSKKKMYYCQACGRTFVGLNTCPICGSRLKTKYVRS